MPTHDDNLASDLWPVREYGEGDDTWEKRRRQLLLTFLEELVDLEMRRPPVASPRRSARDVTEKENACRNPNDPPANRNHDPLTPEPIRFPLSSGSGTSPGSSTSSGTSCSASPPGIPEAPGPSSSGGSWIRSAAMEPSPGPRSPSSGDCSDAEADALFKVDTAETSPDLMERRAQRREAGRQRMREALARQRAARSPGGGDDNGSAAE